MRGGEGGKEKIHCKTNLQASCRVSSRDDHAAEGNRDSYTPNERELTIEKLKLLPEKPEASNQAVISTGAKLRTARNARNKIRYSSTETSLISIAANVKRYIRSLFGTSSKQYKAVSKLVFSKIRRDHGNMLHETGRINCETGSIIFETGAIIFV